MNLQQLHTFPKDHVRALFGLEPAVLSQLLTTVLPELVACRLTQQSVKPNRKRGPLSDKTLYAQSAAAG